MPCWFCHPSVLLRLRSLLSCWSFPSLFSTASMHCQQLFSTSSLCLANAMSLKPPWPPSSLFAWTLPFVCPLFQRLLVHLPPQCQLLLARPGCMILQPRFGIKPFSTRRRGEGAAFLRSRIARRSLSPARPASVSRPPFAHPYPFPRWRVAPARMAPSPRTPQATGVNSIAAPVPPHPLASPRIVSETPPNPSPERSPAPRADTLVIIGVDY